MTDPENKPVKRKHSDKALLQKTLEVLELINSKCPGIHTWEFRRQRTNETEALAFTLLLRELKERFPDGN